jgi:hypothetical protein
MINGFKVGGRPLKAFAENPNENLEIKPLKHRPLEDPSYTEWLKVDLGKIR